MPVITVASSKGGVGKTLVCQILAARLAPHVVAIDADPNRTLYEWRHQVYEGEPFECRAEPDDRHGRVREPSRDRGHGVRRCDPRPDDDEPC